LGDDIPIIFLFVELEKSVIGNLINSHMKSESIFCDVIEQEIKSPDNSLSAAVATDLLEAISI
jgi:hypothetical protein